MSGHPSKTSQTPQTPIATPAGNADRWYSLDTLTGRLVTLRALTLDDAAGYCAAATAAGAGDEVFQWTGRGRPAATPQDAEDEIVSALSQRARGERLAYAQFDSGSGTFIGTSSFYEVSPATRSLAIGYTWLGRPWWRTGHNTESKLLMLAHAFETLGAVRVVWHTDIFNVRSQQAIERLGATREAVLRKHKIRFDGTWRDTVQYSMTDDDWPDVRQRLSARLVQTDD